MDPKLDISWVNYEMNNFYAKTGFIVCNNKPKQQIVKIHNTTFSISDTRNRKRANDMLMTFSARNWICIGSDDITKRHSQSCIFSITFPSFRIDPWLPCNRNFGDWYVAEGLHAEQTDLKLSLHEKSCWHQGKLLLFCGRLYGWIINSFILGPSNIKFSS